MKHQVLLIIQNIELRQDLYARLGREGLIVLTAPSAETALHALEYERPDVIILDPDLPDMPAAQLLERIRSFEPNAAVLVLDSEGAASFPGTQITLPRGVTHETLLMVIQLCLAASSRQTQGNCAHKNILVIDDELRMRTITQRILELNGFCVSVAGSGEEGLRLLENTNVEGVVLDIRMAGMDGLVVLKKIRDHTPQLPVIIMTHADEDNARAEAERLGVTAYLTKPVNFDELKQLLSTATLPAAPAANTKFPASSANGSGSNGSHPAVPQP